MTIKVLITTSIRKMQKKNKLSKFDLWAYSKAQNNCNLDFKMFLRDHHASIALEERPATKFLQTKNSLKATQSQLSFPSLIFQFHKTTQQELPSRMEQKHPHNSTINFYHRLLKEKTTVVTPKKKLSAICSISSSGRPTWRSPRNSLLE